MNSVPIKVIVHPRKATTAVRISTKRSNNGPLSIANIFADKHTKHFFFISKIKQANTKPVKIEYLPRINVICHSLFLSLSLYIYIYIEELEIKSIFFLLFILIFFFLASSFLFHFFSSSFSVFLFGYIRRRRDP